jgi:Mrp family chromosome partitioning ATPase
MPEANSKLIGFAESDIRARPFKLLRTMLSRQLVEGRANIIGVTSPSPNAGKSFIASNLAAAMGRIVTNDVLLVDLDLQRASIAEVFEITETSGVTEYLLGQTEDLSRIAHRVEGTNLTIFPAIAKSSNSAELLSGERLSSLITYLKAYGQSPTIICDLPPLFVSDDAMLAAQHLDGVIMVVEQGVTTKKQLEASLQLLYPTKLIGTIFNRYSGSFGDPYGYSASYGSYYK